MAVAEPAALRISAAAVVGAEPEALQASTVAAETAAEMEAAVAPAGPTVVETVAVGALTAEAVVST
jgi:hypothetical protein